MKQFLTTTCAILAAAAVIAPEQVLYVMAGIALSCGAFTSYHGNRAWLRPSPFAPREPCRTNVTCTCSSLIGTVGIGLSFFPVIFQMSIGGWPAHKSPSLVLLLLVLFVATISGFLLFHALRTGRGFWRFGIVDRDETHYSSGFMCCSMRLRFFLILFA